MQSTVSKLKRTVAGGCIVGHVAATLLTFGAVVGVSAALPAASASAEDEPANGYWLASRCKGARLAYEARRDNISGRVSVLYDVLPNGRVDNIRITESVPEGVMDRNVKSAMRGWRYFAYMKDGVEMGRKDVALTFTFGPNEAEKGKECTHTPLPESTTAALNN
ncbi:energy transducer TonB [Kordiimonas aestuarii]|uniref:energy transducer TonB n=1 Tax=Kordiimonas aestuarii TaxID=1005925 RepID=UPI0021CE792D|nr:energy transducer TonB [Kordiimonas aestuarii]